MDRRRSTEATGKERQQADVEVLSYLPRSALTVSSPRLLWAAVAVSSMLPAASSLIWFGSLGPGLVWLGVIAGVSLVAGMACWASLIAAGSAQGRPQFLRIAAVVIPSNCIGALCALFMDLTPLYWFVDVLGRSWLPVVAVACFLILVLQLALIPLVFPVRGRLLLLYVAPSWCASTSAWLVVYWILIP